MIVIGDFKDAVKTLWISRLSLAGRPEGFSWEPIQTSASLPASWSLDCDEIRESPARMAGCLSAMRALSYLSLLKASQVGNTSRAPSWMTVPLLLYWVQFWMQVCVSEIQGRQSSRALIETISSVTIEAFTLEALGHTHTHTGWGLPSARVCMTFPQ